MYAAWICSKGLIYGDGDPGAEEMKDMEQTGKCTA